MSDSFTDRLESALAGRYKIARKLGEGGMATVYLAEDVKHERQVAIKILRPELAAVIGAARFLYYVMPYIEGENLRDRIEREGQLGVEDAVRIARDVADALDYAHRNDIIHYMSPEQASADWNRRLFDPSSDEEPTRYLETEELLFDASVSPDGTMAAYRSQDAQETAIYLRSFPTAIVTEGFSQGNHLDVHPDGNRLIAVDDAGELQTASTDENAEPERHIVVFNWFQELRERLEGGG